MTLFRHRVRVNGLSDNRRLRNKARPGGREGADFRAESIAKSGALMKLLITGGAGFIGSAVARAVIGKSVDQILVLDKLTYAGNLASLRPIADSSRFAFLQADICDAVAVARAYEDFFEEKERGSCLGRSATKAMRSRCGPARRGRNSSMRSQIASTTSGTYRGERLGVLAAQDEEAVA